MKNFEKIGTCSGEKNKNIQPVKKAKDKKKINKIAIC